VYYQSAVDEFEQKLELAHNRGVEDDEAFAKAKAASSAARARKLKTPGKLEQIYIYIYIYMTNTDTVQTGIKLINTEIQNSANPIHVQISTIIS